MPRDINSPKNQAIIIVEEDTALRKALTKAAEEKFGADHLVFPCKNCDAARAALPTMRAQQVALTGVLTHGLPMEPGLNGIQLLGLIREQGGPTGAAPVVIFGGESIEEKARQAGVTKFVRRSGEPKAQVDEVIGALAQAIESHAPGPHTKSSQRLPRNRERGE